MSVHPAPPNKQSNRQFLVELVQGWWERGPKSLWAWLVLIIAVCGIVQLIRWMFT